MVGVTDCPLLDELELDDEEPVLDEIELESVHVVVPSGLVTQCPVGASGDDEPEEEQDMPPLSVGWQPS